MNEQEINPQPPIDNSKNPDQPSPPSSITPSSSRLDPENELPSLLSESHDPAARRESVGDPTLSNFQPLIESTSPQIPIDSHNADTQPFIPVTEPNPSDIFSFEDNQPSTPESTNLDPSAKFDFDEHDTAPEPQPEYDPFDTVDLNEGPALEALITKNISEGKDTLHDSVLVLVKNNGDAIRIHRENLPFNVRAAIRIINEEQATKADIFKRIDTLGSTKLKWQRAHETFDTFKAQYFDQTKAHQSDKHTDKEHGAHKRGVPIFKAIKDFLAYRPLTDLDPSAHQSKKQGGGIVERDIIDRDRNVPYVPLSTERDTPIPLESEQPTVDHEQPTSPENSRAVPIDIRASLSSTDTTHPTPEAQSQISASPVDTTNVTAATEDFDILPFDDSDRPVVNNNEPAPSSSDSNWPISS